MNERLLGDDCLKCGTPMWAEGHIADDIKLCHSRYNIDTLMEYGYVNGDDLYEFYNDK